MLGDARLHLFRMEFDDEKHELMFWYVGLAHDLQRPEGALDSEFCKYAEMYVRQAGEEEERERENGQGGGRRRAKGEEAEEEEEVEEPEEEMDSSPLLVRSKMENWDERREREEERTRGEKRDRDKMSGEEEGKIETNTKKVE